MYASIFENAVTNQTNQGTGLKFVSEMLAHIGTSSAGELFDFIPKFIMIVGLSIAGGYIYLSNRK